MRTTRALVLSVATLSGVLASCGGDNNDVASSTADSTEATVATTTEATTEATDAAASTTAAAAAGQGGPPTGGVTGGGPNSCSASGTAPDAAPVEAVPKASDTTTLAAAVAAANDFLATLSADQKSATTFDYADLDAKRCSWSNFPLGIFNGRVGQKLGDLTDEQKAAALKAVESLMSAAGYTYVEGAMAGDQYLADTQGNSQFGIDNYYLAFYGTPSADTPWTLQFGGHHLAIHISVGGDTLSVSPYFQGIQPISFEVNGQTIEAMKSDSDHLFGIFESMDATQLEAAKLDGAYDDLVMGPGTDAGYPAQDGLSYTELTADQQALVKAAIADWVGDAAPSLSGPLLDLYNSQLDQTTVSWSTSTDRDAPAYMRIDGPRVWIEWVNTTGGGGLHVHSLYRDKLIDYGTGTNA